MTASMTSRALPRVGAAVLVIPCLASGCASTPIAVTPGDILSTVVTNLPIVLSGTPTSGSTTARRRIPNSPAASSRAAQLLSIANSYVGVKYTWGGNTPSEGFDCSGFTKYIFAKQGIALPRTSREQARVGQHIPADFGAMVPGDLMFFAEPGQAVSHVAIYVGDGRIIHSAGSVGGVGYTDLNRGGDWFVDYFVEARRVE